MNMPSIVHWCVPGVQAPVLPPLLDPEPPPLLDPEPPSLLDPELLPLLDPELLPDAGGPSFLPLSLVPFGSSVGWSMPARDAQAITHDSAATRPATLARIGNVRTVRGYHGAVEGRRAARTSAFAKESFAGRGLDERILRAASRQ